jgi:spermidine/putrescine-binding protein
MILSTFFFQNKHIFDPDQIKTQNNISQHLMIKYFWNDNMLPSNGTNIKLKDASTIRTWLDFLILCNTLILEYKISF